jgi:hypothetical protein
VIRKLLAASILLLGCLSAAPAAHASTVHATARPATRVVANCVDAVYKPKRIIIACGDGNLVLTKMRYKTWTAHEATGSGTMYVNECEPDCASGKWATTYTHFTLDRTKKVGKHDQPRFSRLVAVYPHHHGKHHREVYHLVTTRI